MVNKLKKAKEDIEELKRKTDDKREIDFKAHENTENGSKDPLKSDSFDLELSQNQKTDYWLDKPFGVVIFTLNMAKNIIGSFLIFIPWTFTLSGVVLGNIMLVLIYFFTAYSFSLIGFLGKKTRKNSYSLMFEDIGKWLVVLVDLSIIGITISANAGYQLVISSRIMSIIKFYQNYDFPNWAIVLIVSIFVLFPLSLFKRLDSLRFVSITAFVAIIFLVAGILYFIFDLDTSKAEISLFSKTPYSFFVAFPILAGNFDCHTNAVTFFLEYSDKTKNPSFKKYTAIVFSAFGIVLIVTCLFGTVSYMTIGNILQPDALSQYPQGILITLMSISVCYSLVVSYALFLNSIRLSAHIMVFNTILGQHVDMTFLHLFIETAIIVLLTVVIAAPKPDIGFFSAAAWAIFGSLLVYIYPTVLAIKTKALPNIYLKIFNIVVLLFGILISMIAGFVTSIIEWVNA